MRYAKDHLFYSQVKGYSVSAHELHKQIKTNYETGKVWKKALLFLELLSKLCGINPLDD